MSHDNHITMNHNDMSSMVMSTTMSMMSGHDHTMSHGHDTHDNHGGDSHGGGGGHHGDHSQHEFDDGHVVSKIVNVYAITVLAICLCIYIPIAIYGISKFRRYRHNIVIRKRYPQITLVMGILLSLTIITCALRAFLEAFYTEYQWWTFHPMIALLASVSVWMLLKAYLNYYAIQYSNAIMASEWKKIINPDTEGQNWFILNRMTYGSYTRWRPFAILLVVMNFVAVYLWDFTADVDEESKYSVLNWIGICCACVCVVFMAVIRYKTPKLNDVFHQREELGKVIIVCSILILLKVGLHALHHLIICVQGFEFIHISESFLFATLSIYIVYVSTLWVMQKNKHWMKMSMLQQRNTMDVSNAMPHLDPNAISDSHQDADLYAKVRKSLDRKTAEPSSGGGSKFGDAKVIQINQVLANAEGFEALLFHFAQEFSMETMLSLIEMTQFQREVYESFGRIFGVIDAEMDQKHWLVLPENVPKSAIVYGHFSAKDSVQEKDKTENASNIDNKLEGIPEMDGVEVIYDDSNVNGIDNETETVNDTKTTSPDTHDVNDDKNQVSKDSVLGNEEDDMSVVKYVEFVSKAREIYEKYVKIGSELEVNISYKQRNDVTTNLEGLQNGWEGVNETEDQRSKFKQIYNLFIPTMKELHRLMDGAFGRFKKSALFEKLISI